MTNGSPPARAGVTTSRGHPPGGRSWAADKTNLRGGGGLAEQRHRRRPLQLGRRRGRRPPRSPAEHAGRGGADRRGRPTRAGGRQPDQDVQGRRGPGAIVPRWASTPSPFSPRCSASMTRPSTSSSPPGWSAGLRLPPARRRPAPEVTAVTEAGPTGRGRTGDPERHRPDRPSGRPGRPRRVHRGVHRGPAVGFPPALGTDARYPGGGREPGGRRDHRPGDRHPSPDHHRVRPGRPRRPGHGRLLLRVLAEHHDVTHHLQHGRLSRHLRPPGRRAGGWPAGTSPSDRRHFGVAVTLGSRARRAARWPGGRVRPPGPPGHRPGAAGRAVAAPDHELVLLM